MSSSVWSYDSLKPILIIGRSLQGLGELGMSNILCCSSAYMSNIYAGIHKLGYFGFMLALLKDSSKLTRP
jgi:hypothetical protein